MTTTRLGLFDAPFSSPDRICFPKLNRIERTISIDVAEVYQPAVSATGRAVNGRELATAWAPLVMTSAAVAWALGKDQKGKSE